MPGLRKLTLSFDRSRRDWVLREEGAANEIARFDSKESALGGRLADLAREGSGASVKIQREDGSFEEERTYPRSADPRKSIG
jgi:hypothetical protein